MRHLYHNLNYYYHHYCLGVAAECTVVAVATTCGQDFFAVNVVAAFAAFDAFAAIDAVAVVVVAAAAAVAFVAEAE